MLSALEGLLYRIEEDFVIIQLLNSLYVHVNMSRTDHLQCNDTLKLFTILRIREDRMVLYGFQSKDEQTCFEWLTEVPGIGPKTALQVLKQMSPRELLNAVNEEKIDLLVAVPGIGPSTAKKMLPYLAAKMKKQTFISMDDLPQDASIQIREETRLWLMDIGLSPNEADREIRDYFEEHGGLPACEELVASILQKRKK